MGLFNLFCLVVFLQSVSADKFLSFDERKLEKSIIECGNPAAITCHKVNVDVEALLNSEELELPNGLKMTRMALNPNRVNDNSAFTFKNEDELLEAVFVTGQTSNKFWMSGSVHWAKEGRQFQLALCNIEGVNDIDAEDCYTWSEISLAERNKLQKLQEGPSRPDQQSLKGMKVEREFTEETLRLIQRGREDKTTIAYISVTIYTTIGFRESFQNNKPAIDAFINQQIATNNQGYVNSNIPIVFNLKCIIDSYYADTDEDYRIWFQSTGGNYNALRKSADLTLFFCGPNCLAYYCGQSHGGFDVNNFNNQGEEFVRDGPTFAITLKDCMGPGSYVFGHEASHLFGCDHNREQVNPADPSSPTGYHYGYLLRPPLNSGYHTVMSYGQGGYETTVNHYSNPNVYFGGNIPTGTLDSDNARLLTENRFVIEAIGNEMDTCQ